MIVSREFIVSGKDWCFEAEGCHWSMNLLKDVTTLHIGNALP
jgi:hypothetical protein